MFGLGIKRKVKFFIKVNWIKTVYFNFKMFPFKIAKKLPVFFYGSVKFTSLSGEIIIDAPIKRAMVGFGQKFEITTLSKENARFHLEGKLVFKGHAHIGNDYLFFVGKHGYCEFGFMGCLGSDVKLICTNRIVLGNWTGVAYESQLIDTNSHPMKDTKTGKQFPISGQIELGNYNMVSNRVSVMLNTKTPDYCVIASNSLCNKDYTKYGTEILIGGVPAKLIKTNFKRDYESEKENLLRFKCVKL